MKTITYIFIIIFSICLYVACDVTETSNDLENEIGINQIEQDVSAESRAVERQRTVPFKARFFTEGIVNEEDPEDPEASGPFKGGCTEEPFIIFNVQEGSGQATHLGKFSTRITFCVDPTDLMDDGMLTGEESIPYNKGKGVFIAANGDELYFTVSGEILPTDHPDYDFEFQDPFTFTGGTGRFEGATGSGMTDSLVDFAVDRTDHKWTGSIKFDR